MNAVLGSVKKIIGSIPDEDDHFDEELIVYINGVLSVLSTQIDVRFPEAVHISGKYDEWTDIIPKFDNMRFVEEYVGLKVYLLFDKTLPSHVRDAIQKQIDEYEWRLYIMGCYEEGV